MSESVAETDAQALAEVAAALDRAFSQEKASTTKEILKEILAKTKEQDSEYIFTCAAGMAPIIMQRVRVMLSRMRARMQAEGYKMQHFRLCSKIDAVEQNGQLVNQVKVWRFKSGRSEIQEVWDDLTRGKVNG